MSSHLFTVRMHALDALLAVAQAQGLLVGAEVRDTSNRSGRDWPWWSVDISHTYVVGPVSCRTTATIWQASTPEGEVGELQGRWRGEVWRDVAANWCDVSGSQPLIFSQLFPVEAFMATLAQLLQHAREALLKAGAAQEVDGKLYPN